MIDGSGKETELNGTGNLILGYDEAPGSQIGSHNLLLGGTGNSYTSYGGIVGGGFSNKISGPYASILGGAENTSSGYASTITGGHSNTATANYSTVSGGCSNLAGAGTPTINSGCTTSHPGYFASIAGGAGNQASAQNSAVSGGEKNTASAINASVTGGYGNKATGRWDSVTGGYENIAGITEESSEFHGANSISGGAFNEATGPGQSWIGSGEYGKASGSHSALVGGYKGTVSGTNATVGGGAESVSSGEDAAVTGGSKNKAETTDSLAPNPEGLTVLSKDSVVSQRRGRQYARVCLGGSEVSAPTPSTTTLCWPRTPWRNQRGRQHVHDASSGCAHGPYQSRERSDVLLGAAERDRESQGIQRNQLRIRIRHHHLLREHNRLCDVAGLGDQGCEGRWTDRIRAGGRHHVSLPDLRDQLERDHQGRGCDVCDVVGWRFWALCHLVSLDIFRVFRLGAARLLALLPLTSGSRRHSPLCAEILERLLQWPLHHVGATLPHRQLYAFQRPAFISVDEYPSIAQNGEHQHRRLLGIG